ncbi:oxidoreductase [Hypoxylon crocopeplum]|nr:oxidoreductase [Hypoxylon crocopeplum]
MEDNFAAYLVRFKRRPLDVDEADSRFPEENEIVVKNAAVSVNPIDITMQDEPFANWTYPLILGADVAGEVVEVGSEVSRFSVGDRVMGHALRLATDDDRHAGFQNYTVLMPNMACPIPPSLSYEDAATLPLGISTAAAALFQKDKLNLEPPVLYPPTREEWVIVTGATGNVGSHGVRLASAAGYKVLALASWDKFQLARDLGAAEVLNSRPQAPLSLESTLVQALSGKKIAGAFDTTAAKSVIAATANAVAKCEGNRFVASVTDWVDPKSVPPPEEVQVETIMAIAIRENEVSKMVYEDFLPVALATGKYVIPYPKALVYGDGLGVIQGAMGAKAGAGEKVVVTLK